MSTRALRGRRLAAVAAVGFLAAGIAASARLTRRAADRAQHTVHAVENQAERAGRQHNPADPPPPHR